jgi:Family of unknown function (DUF5955)
VSKDRIGPCTRTDLAPDTETPDVAALGTHVPGATALDALTPDAALDAAPAGGAEDPRVTELRAAIGRLRRELAGYRVPLSDRPVAEDELAILDAQAASGTLSVPRLRRSLLVVAGSLGSVSALAAPVAQIRRAIDLFGPVPGRAPGAM